MSHFVTIETQIRDVTSLDEVVQLAGLDFSQRGSEVTGRVAPRSFPHGLPQVGDARSDKRSGRNCRVFRLQQGRRFSSLKATAILAPGDALLRVPAVEVAGLG